MMNASNESRSEWITQINSGDYSNLSRFSTMGRYGSRGPPEVTKTLYLQSNGTSDIMNTTVGTGSSSTNVRISNLQTNDWFQTPSMAGNFSLSGTINVYLYLDPTRATGLLNQGWPDLTVTLSHGTTTIGSDIISDIDTAGWYTFVISPIVSNVPENATINLEAYVTSARRGIFGGRDGYVDVYYDSTTYNSRMVMQTDTCIKVNWIKIYNQSGNETNVFNPGDNFTIRANVTDPLGLYDIKYVNMTMLMPDDSINPALNDVEMTTVYSEDTIAPYFWRIYEYNYTIPSAFPTGWYSIWVNATESNGVKDISSINFIMPPVLGVSVFPDLTEYVSEATIQNFSFTVKNIGNSTETYDISVSSSSQGWRSDLYFGTTLVAYDSNGDGIWDWIFSNYDSNSDGNPDINLTSLQEANITLQKTVPITLKSKTDITTITATSALNSSILDNATATCVYSLAQKVKNLYLHENGGTDQMDTFVGSGASSTSVRIGDEGSHSWIHTPVFASDFNITDNISVYLYIDPTPATGWFSEGNPDVEVVLTYNSSFIGSYKITNLVSTQWYTFPITSAVSTIPKGSAITCTVNVDSCRRGLGRSRRDGWIDLYYNSSLRDSRIDLPTDTYISIESLNTYNLTSNSTQTEFSANDFVEIRANITDPFGVQDTSAYIYITSPGGTFGDIANGVAMGNYSTDPNSPFFWQVYNYSFQLPATPVNGTYTINVIAMETNGVFVNATTTFIVPGANVTVTPDHYLQVSPGINVTYSHTITNNAPFSDRFEISVTSSQNWNITIYNDTNNNGVLDSGDEMMAYDSNGDGNWDWVNSSYDSDSDSLPDTGILGPDQQFKIIVEVHVPVSSGYVNETTKIFATSNYDTSVSDYAVDTTACIPEYSSIFYPMIILLLLIVIFKKNQNKLLLRRNKKGSNF